MDCVLHTLCVIKLSDFFRCQKKSIYDVHEVPSSFIYQLLIRASEVYTLFICSKIRDLSTSRLYIFVS